MKIALAILGVLLLATVARADSTALDTFTLFGETFQLPQTVTIPEQSPACSSISIRCYEFAGMAVPAGAYDLQLFGTAGDDDPDGSFYCWDPANPMLEYCGDYFELFFYDTLPYTVTGDQLTFLYGTFGPLTITAEPEPSGLFLLGIGLFSMLFGIGVNNRAWRPRGCVASTRA